MVDERTGRRRRHAGGATVTTRSAKRFAERTHAGVLDRYGEPVLDHVRRVAAAVPPPARTVAWLHESFEYTTVSAAELRAAGATADELRAVRLLTRKPDAGVAAYRAHVEKIARASGHAGELARIVKRADLRDRLDHQGSRTPVTATRPAYLTALTLLTAGLGCSTRGRSRTASPTPQRPKRSATERGEN